MAKAMGRPVVTVTVAFEIDEEEARALEALASCQHVINFNHALLEDHKHGIHAFLDTVRDIVGPAIHQADEVRSLLHGQGGE